MSNIKPCPFCGGKAQSGSDAYREQFINSVFGYTIEPAARKAWVYCTVCGAVGPGVYDKEYNGFKSVDREKRIEEQAISAWNQRTE